MIDRLPRLDRIDLNILAELQRQGRITNADLADRVGLSPSPCLARVKRLERAGYIAGYGARLDLAKLFRVQVVYTSVTLDNHRREDFDTFEAGLRSVEELTECHLVSGGFDYLLKFVVRDVAHYQSLVEGLLDRHIGISKYFSYIVIKSPILRGEVSVKSLA
ncbi:Lrp/AsnC family transcriptional regulator [Pseudoxanthomonas winnipegensis]|uniref:DNA-binding Lrp family transcriptional regulator n=1 Tax=Pseudoxanthomonas winnipegensis TaxID=2480810 RepID=A0A4V2KKR8_9GAMM|nr:winged helix-turn-helix transcriptional regulator [uncultured Pseudoxanthomonas sp.]MDQ1118099.1 DNA-binding Lrp family transcriptional regulator [Pseudoxanthomonas winnipegensis]MDR6138700.1 DNA-binding Lrp family transcriptional regulator [Pseudoxanthomonas sp. SORGH_AS_0997]MDQ1135069.1 DNA-binding Lrp family transcriptional regulator [Pseudoxanthomonas winnipegensis]TAA12125.1 winged helix-turn-helix transcriptional regulator [Pseudoxanthomonas winnipegensis]TAA19511.1 winged helix-turn